MNTHTEIFNYKGNEIARVIRSHEIENLQFFTEDSTFLQVGLHNKERGAQVIPHAHRCTEFAVNRMEEVFFIVKGKVLVTLYDQNTGDIIKKVVLKRGDTLIHLQHGHGLDFLQPTVMFEVKQGPFTGTKDSKIYFHNLESKNK